MRQEEQHKPTRAQRSSVSRAAAQQASQQVGHMNTSLRRRQGGGVVVVVEVTGGGVKDSRNTDLNGEKLIYRGKEEMK